MSGPLAPAAPSRLRMAAGAGGQRCASVYLRQSRARAQVLDDWARAGRQFGWIAVQAKLHTRPLFGTGLDRLCGAAEGRQDVAPKSKTARKSPPKMTPKPARAAKTLDLAPRTLLPIRPAETSEAVTRLPAHVAPGQLRLWSAADPNLPEHKSPVRIFAIAKPAGANPRPLPASATVSAWPDRLANRTAERFQDTQSQKSGAASFNGALAHPLTGPTASHHLLCAAISRAKPDHRAEHTRAAHSTPQNMAVPPYLIRPTGRTTAATAGHPARTPQTQIPASTHPTAHAASATRPDMLTAPFRRRTATSDTIAPITDDPLSSDVIGPPAHTPAAETLQQPDFAHPFAEVLPPESRKAMSRAQGTIADEPLAELPPLPRDAALTPRFDRDELGEALAEILRDEARRHGIDV